MVPAAQSVVAFVDNCRQAVSSASADSGAGTGYAYARAPGDPQQIAIGQCAVALPRELEIDLPALVPDREALLHEVHRRKVLGVRVVPAGDRALCRWTAPKLDAR